MRAPHVMMGYYGNEAETNIVLKKHDDGFVWVHSGDLGHIDEDGCVFIQGRIKRMIIRHDGFKVYPTLIESVVAAHPAIRACCAVGKDDSGYNQGKLSVVFVVLKPECQDMEKNISTILSEYCEKELPEYALPVAYYVRDSLPLTAIGKVDYRTLEKECNE